MNRNVVKSGIVVSVVQQKFKTKCSGLVSQGSDWWEAKTWISDTEQNEQGNEGEHSLPLDESKQQHLPLGGGQEWQLHALQLLLAPRLIYLGRKHTRTFSFKTQPVSCKRLWALETGLQIGYCGLHAFSCLIIPPSDTQVFRKNGLHCCCVSLGDTLPTSSFNRRFFRTSPLEPEWIKVFWCLFMRKYLQIFVHFKTNVRTEHHESNRNAMLHQKTVLQLILAFSCTCLAHPCNSPIQTFKYWSKYWHLDILMLNLICNSVLYTWSWTKRPSIDIICISHMAGFSTFLRDSTEVLSHPSFLYSLFRITLLVWKYCFIPVKLPYLVDQIKGMGTNVYCDRVQRV